MRRYSYGTAQALLAFQHAARAEQSESESELAFVGALFWAEHIDNMRSISALLMNTAKATQKQKRRAKTG